LIIFAREPQTGKVKTRLHPHLSHRDILSIYKSFIKDVLCQSRKAPTSKKFLYYAGSACSLFFLRQFGTRFILKQQRGESLGERMFRAFKFSLGQGLDKVILIGTDCLTITSLDFQKAFNALDIYDCVFGPAKDGGYYLVGLKEAQWGLFQNISWGTSDVLKESLRAAKRLKLKTKLLSVKEDIDTISSLRKFAKVVEKKRIAPYTTNVLKRIQLESIL
jgi:rSAM/selenodomain-associated transferase 1